MCELLKEKHYKDFIEESLRKHGYENIIIEDVEAFADQGFLGLIFSLDAKVKKNGEAQCLKLVAKIMTTNVNIRKHVALDYFAKRETNFYNKVVPKIENFQNEKNFKRKFEIAKCYGARDELFKEIVIMEDLRHNNYKLSKLKLMDYEHSVLLLTNLAHLHALFFVYKNERLEEYEKLTEDFLDVMFFSDKPANTITLSTTYSEVMKNNKEIENFILTLTAREDLIEILHKLSDGRRYQYATLCHGDAITNNVLFKYEATNPTSTIFVDWQTTRCGSPISDILFFLFTSVDIKLRQEQFQNLIEIYYQELKNSINEFGGNSEKLYPEEIFKRDLKTYSLQPVISALHLLPLFCANKTGSGMSKLCTELVLQMLSDIKKHKLDELW